MLTNVPTIAKIMNERAVRPGCHHQPVRSLDDAIAEANRLPFGLASYAFTVIGQDGA